MTSSPCSEPARWDTKSRPPGSWHQGSISLILCQATKGSPPETKGLYKADLVLKLGNHMTIHSPTGLCVPETADGLWNTENWDIFVLLWQGRVPVGDCFCLAERGTLGREHFNLKKQQHLLVAGSLPSWSPAVVWSHWAPAEWDHARQLGADSTGLAWLWTSLCAEAGLQDKPVAEDSLSPLRGGHQAPE